MSKKDVMAVISLGYSSKVMLPIEEAHRIQAILARHAVKYDTIWNSDRSIHYLQDYEVPEVMVVARPPDFDAQGLDAKVVRDWANAISKSSDDKDAVIMDPHTFAKLAGDTNE
jgi:hypothetical protein